MQKKVTISENDLKEMINETVRRLINEYYGTFDDTRDAPWNSGPIEDYEEKEETITSPDFYLDLTDFIKENPELQKLLKPMVVSGWDEVNLGQVKITFFVERRGEDKEVIKDTVEVKMDPQGNRYAMLLPDKLVDMLNNIATESFNDRDDFEWNVSTYIYDNGYE